MTKKVKSNKRKTAPQLVPVYAAVDVGSNNVRMDLYGVDARGCVRKIDITEETVFPCTLSQGMTKKKPVVKRKNLALAVKAMRAFDAILIKYDIKPENTCTVMTAFARDIQDTVQGKKDIARLAKAYRYRPLRGMSPEGTTLRQLAARKSSKSDRATTEEEEAILIGIAVKIACPRGWRNHRGKRTSIVFGAQGGGSFELGVMTAAGKIKHATALPLGIHPLIKKGRNRPFAAAKIVAHSLHKHYPGHEHKIMAAIGGGFRALAEVECGHLPPAVLKGNIDKKLTRAMHCKPKYYRSLGGSPARRAPYMATGAATLRQAVRHFKANKVIILNKTLRDAMAQQMHALRTGRIRSPSRGLEQLFSP